MARRKPLPKRPRGNPTLLTAELSEQICDVIATTKAPLEDAAATVGVHRATLFTWLQKGRAETSGLYRDFHDAVELARARGTSLMLGHIAKAAQSGKNWQAAKALLEMTERRRFGAQVRIVQEELDATLDRLEQALSPAEFDKVLAAIAADSGRAEAGPTASPAPAVGDSIEAPDDAAGTAPVREVGAASDTEV